MNTVPLESRILYKLDEPLAAGLYEERNASMLKRNGRAMKRYGESVDAMPAADAPLYPSGQLQLWCLNKAATRFDYSFSLMADAARLKEKIETKLTDQREKSVAQGVVWDLQQMCGNPMAQRFVVGGAGYTHSILDYNKIVRDGLPEYGRRVARGLADAQNAATWDFFSSMQEVFEAVMLLLSKAEAACPEGALQDALAAAAQRSPKTFYEALVLINFIYYIDGCDSIGALDRYLAPFYLRDLAAGTLTPADAEAMLGVFFANVEANSGWHLILGGEGVPEVFTILCLRAQKTRRPNCGLKIVPETSDTVWDAAFDCLQRGSGNPSFYNDRTYREGAVKFAAIAPEDLPYIAYGGCTEFMVEGRSNVGSIDGGVNLLRILEGTVMAELAGVASFDEFMDRFKADIQQQIGMMADQVSLNQEYKAIFRPQPIRTLFVEDCLTRGTDYNQGGARYNGGVINVAGIANVANSLYAIQAVLGHTIGITREQLLAALEHDFNGYPGLHGQLLSLPKFGNNVADVDAMAKEITDFTFEHITRCRGWRANGFMIPSTIMFVTYVGQGEDINATPDGRKAGTAIADSCGPMQGTDTQGPTAMLSSTALLPQVQGLGTMILNLRVNAGMLATPGMRRKLRSLLTSYFALGGMQVQLTSLDAEALQDALQHPEAHANLIVRIGGYTEYFNRLDERLKREVIQRTEYL